jgi:drug/metabolite transporter (DMT)-like permease
LEASKKPAILATIWMIGTLVSLATMAVAGRELSSELTTFQILFFRNIVSILVVSVYLSIKGWQLIRTQALPTHVVRNIAHFAGQYGWFYGLAIIPLSEVVAIEFTVPVWTAFLALFMLGEKMTKARIIAVVFGIIGMLMILRPGLATIKPAALAVLAGAVCFAITNIKTKELANVDHPVAILFYMTLIQLPLAMIPTLFDWVVPSSESLPWIVVIGVTALSAHYCITRALQLVDATVVAPMDFMRLPLITVIGFLLYGESIEWAVLFGACVMFVGNYVNIRAENRLPMGIES